MHDRAKADDKDPKFLRILTPCSEIPRGLPRNILGAEPARWRAWRQRLHRGIGANAGWWRDAPYLRNSGGTSNLNSLDIIHTRRSANGRAHEALQCGLVDSWIRPRRFSVSPQLSACGPADPRWLSFAARVAS